MEDESDDASDDDHTFVDMPSTSADDQPGPSGVGKDGTEAPWVLFFNFNWKNVLYLNVHCVVFSSIIDIEKYKLFQDSQNLLVVWV